MFDRTARFYDLLYERGLGKDYAAEAQWVAATVAPASTLLDVACGTGLHLAHLREHLDCAGVDLDAGMVDIARARCPGIPIDVADMCEFDLGRTFDAVVCLFSSIGYAQTVERLHAAVACMARHLDPGGVVLVEPWLQPEQWIVGHVQLLTVDEPDVKIARVSHSDRDGDRSIMDLGYLIATADGIEHHDEHHVLGLFTWDQYRDAFDAAGLATTIDERGGPMGRGLIVGQAS